jgi:excisionase family DNA binding protein
MDILQEIKAGRTPARPEDHDGDGSNDAFGGSVPCDDPAGPEYLTGKQLAEKLNVSLKSICKWTAQHRIPGAVKMGYHWRYSSAEISKRLLSGQLLSPLPKR